MAARKKKCSKSSQTASKKDVMLYKLSSTLAETKTSIAAFSVKPKGLVLVNTTVTNMLQYQATQEITLVDMPPSAARLYLQAP